MIYFDYTATTPIDKEVLDTYIRMQKNFFANSSSAHRLGQESAFMIEKARTQIKETLGIASHDVIFTSNATEANNLAILGIAYKYKTGKIITTKIEHPSVYNVCRHLEEKGYEVVYLDVDKNGVIDIEQFKAELNSRVILVSIMWINNIVGSIQPILEIIQALKKYKKAKLHVDAVQGLGKVEHTFSLDDVDMFTYSAHKLYGPKGVGCLFVKNTIDIHRTLFGSSIQRGIKPGTLDVALCVSCAKSLTKYYTKTNENNKVVTKIRDMFIKKIQEQENILIHSNANFCSPYIVNISVLNQPAETVLRALEQREIYVSSGSACSSKIIAPEKTVFAMTKDENLAKKSVRISFCANTTKNEVQSLVQALISIAQGEANV